MLTSQSLFAAAVVDKSRLSWHGFCLEQAQGIFLESWFARYRSWHGQSSGFRSITIQSGGRNGYSQQSQDLWPFRRHQRSHLFSLQGGGCTDHRTRGLQGCSQRLTGPSNRSYLGICVLSIYDSKDHKPEQIDYSDSKRA